MKSSSVDQIILQTLEREPSHLTVQQIYEQIRAHLPAVNPSTIYRALERMAKSGQVSVSDIGLGAAVYEAVGRKRHHHLICQNCGNFTTIADELVQTMFKTITDAYHFQIATNHLILYGICPQCQQEHPPED